MVGVIYRGVKSDWCHKTNNGFNYVGTQGGKFDGDKYHRCNFICRWVDTLQLLVLNF